MTLKERKRRVSRFRRRYSGPEPKFQVGDKAGGFNVIGYLGHSAIRPDALVKLSQEHHWYLVRCKCGTEETHSQQQLIDTRRRRICSKCQAQLDAASIQ